MTQERKAQIAPAVKAILAEYGLKGSLGVHHHSSLVLTIKSGHIDFFGSFSHRVTDMMEPPTNSMPINTHWCHEQFTGDAQKCLVKLCDAMNVGNHDNSDIQSDYFDVGWYIGIDVGKWDKPYVRIV